MNHIYYNIWNEVLGAWIAVSIITKGQGKRLSNRRKLLATGLLICSTSVVALPTGDQLAVGQATVSIPSANLMEINQNSQNAIINWQGFSIAPNETVNIQQRNASVALLNRVVGQDASQIQGQLTANGQVYIVNPNGVLFSKTAQVDVGSLVATTHSIKNSDFLSGKPHFTQDGATGSVDNQGVIKTPDGGIVALIGESVSNSGTIITPKGTTALAAGKTIDLDFTGDGLVEVNVSESALNAQITNKGVIQADGGRIVLTAKAAGQLIDTVINQSGIIRAQGLTERNGEIILEGGYVAQTGTLDASSKTGGTIDIKARTILDTGSANADGGKITLDVSGSKKDDLIRADDNFHSENAKHLNAKTTTINGVTTIKTDGNDQVVMLSDQQTSIQVDSERLTSQISPLQTSTVVQYSYNPTVNPIPEEMSLLIRTENGGIQLPEKQLRNAITIMPTISCIRLPPMK